MLSKILLFLTAVLVSCSPPPAEEDDELPSEAPSSSERFKNRESSREYFHYQLTDCVGVQSDLFNNVSSDGSFLDISMDDGKALIVRNGMDPSMNATLTGNWDHSNGQLTDLSGYFGISTTEDWSLAEGLLHISSEEVTANISGVQIEYVGSNKRGNIDISCSLSLTIGTKKD